MPPVAERRSRGATLALPLLIAVGLYGVFYVSLDVRTVPQVKLTTPVPSVHALRAGRLRDADALRAHSTAEAAVKLRGRPRGSDVEAPAPAPDLAPLGQERVRPLLSQRTPAWDRLREEGLFHDNSGYLRIEPQNADELAEKTFWEERVLHEFRDGACVRGRTALLAAHARPQGAAESQTTPSSVFRSSSSWGRHGRRSACSTGSSHARAPPVQGGDHCVVRHASAAPGRAAAAQD